MVLIGSKPRRDLRASLTMDILLRYARRNPIIRSSLNAFLAAYLYAVVPRLISLTSRTIRKRASLHHYLRRICQLLQRGLAIDGFPVFITKLVAGTHILNYIVRSVIGRILSTTSHKRSASLHLTKFLSALISAKWFFSQYKKALDARRARYQKGSYEACSHEKPVSVNTLDITTFTAIRAADLLIRSSPLNSHSPILSQSGDVLFFTASSAIVMFAWFYYPEKLPPSYQKWITMAANMDDELVEALRKLRNGEIVYGEVGSNEDLLVGMCKKAHLDPDLGRFSKTVPLPCRVVHVNICDSCELHALWRLYRGFVTALSIYLPINILVSIVSRRISKKSLARIVRQSARSSLFLGAFIALNWYCVCLVRTRLGPKLFPNLTPQQLEDSYGPGLGSAMCGLSSVIESSKRRGELGLFVAPKALEVLLKDASGKNSILSASLETTVFAFAFACLATYPDHTRGWLRKLVTKVF